MWARCRSTGPGRWARPRTWWQWSRAVCSLDCIQTAPPCPRQSRSRCAFQTWAPGPSCTEWRSSWGRLWVRSDEDEGHGRTRRHGETKRRGRVAGCVRWGNGGLRETARQSRWREKTANFRLISPQDISHSALRRSGAGFLFLCLGPWTDTANCVPPNALLCDKCVAKTNLFFQKEENAIAWLNQLQKVQEHNGSKYINK